MSRSISRSISRRFSSAQADERGPKIFAGYLLKKGKFNTGYQKRWFVLYSNNTLAYFQDKFAAEALPLGDINLYCVTEIKEERNNIFHLLTPKRKFILKCTLKDELDGWIKKLKLRVSPNIICQGWLHKTGSNNKSFKLRYFKLCEYELHYEARYYEDEQCTKYKGKINCDRVEEIKILPNTSVKTYGKDRVLELLTPQRTYAVAAIDTKSRNLWYKSFKQAVYGVDVDKGKEKERYEQQRMEEELTQAKLFDSLSTSVLTQSIKEDQAVPLMAENETTTKEEPVSKLEPKPEAKPIHHPYPFHYQKSPEPFTTHTVKKALSDPGQHKKRKSLNDFFAEPIASIEKTVDGGDEEDIEPQSQTVEKEEFNPDGFNPMIEKTNTENVETEENRKDSRHKPRIQDTKHTIDKHDSMISNDEYSPRDTRNNTTVIHHESSVFSNEFLNADYEDPSYGLLGNQEPNKRTNKCCTIL